MNSVEKYTSQHDEMKKFADLLHISFRDMLKKYLVATSNEKAEVYLDRIDEEELNTRYEKYLPKDKENPFIDEFKQIIKKYYYSCMLKDGYSDFYAERGIIYYERYGWGYDKKVYLFDFNYDLTFGDIYSKSVLIYGEIPFRDGKHKG